MDITRNIYDADQRFATVIFQQGKATTEDDINEAQRIALEEQRRRTLDIVGPAGTPDDGFRIADVRDNGGRLDFTIGSGTYYAGGVRAEQRTDSSYLDQPDWLAPTEVPADLGTTVLAYLEFTHQDITAAENKELLEAALGGVDTTGRQRTMWRLRVAEVGTASTCADAWASLAHGFAATGQGAVQPGGEVTVDTTAQIGFEAATAASLCAPTSPGFAGAENQLVRIQLTANGFTWGYDNASPLTQVTVNGAGQVLTLLAAPRDTYHQPRQGQVLEVLAQTATLSNGEPVAARTGFLTTAATPYDSTSGELRLSDPLPTDFPTDDGAGNALPVFLRVWNRGDDVGSAPEILYTSGSAVPLGSTGLSVTFRGSDHVEGDFWLAAARPVASDVIVPWRLTDSLGGAGPHGVRRFIAPLARIKRLASGYEVSDCRVPLRTLGRPVCCSVDVNPTTWLSTLDRLMDDWRTTDLSICFGPGDYHLPGGRDLTFSGRRSVRLTGQGRGTVIHARDRETVLGFEDVDHVHVEGITLLVAGEAASAQMGRVDSVRGVVDIRRARTAHVTSVTARTLAAPRPAMACVVAAGSYFAEAPGIDVTVDMCTLVPGANQVGVLALDVERATVAGNRVGRPAEIRMKQGHLERFLEDPGYRRRLGKLVFRNARAAPKEVHTGEHVVQTRGARVAFRSVAGLGEEVAQYIERETASRGRAGLRAGDLIDFAHGLLGEPLRTDSPLAVLRALREQVRRNRPPAAGSAVVVAGRRADHVRVAGNDISDTRSGVIVAVSDTAAEKEAAENGRKVPTFSAGRVSVTDNTIQLLVTLEGLGLPHRGVQVGNARAVQVHGNDIGAERKGLTKELGIPTEGVRLWGRFGQRLAVSETLFSWLDTGIKVRELAGSTGVFLAHHNTFDHVTTDLDR